MTIWWSTNDLPKVTCLNWLMLLLVGEGGVVPAGPVFVPHSSGEGIYGPEWWPNWWISGRRRSVFAGPKGLHRLLPWWSCSGQRCHEVGERLRWQTGSLCSTWVKSCCFFSADMASHFWVLKVKTWKFATVTTTLKCEIVNRKYMSSNNLSPAVYLYLILFTP